MRAAKRVKGEDESGRREGPVLRERERVGEGAMAPPDYCESEWERERILIVRGESLPVGISDERSPLDHGEGREGKGDKGSRESEQAARNRQRNGPRRSG